ncbi:hypothetical protein SAMN05444157_3441 [Frankineae bacterium MT45]|nr:hypothetical protein SAMN05444157_3441 [Frankineae bacterium MT45]
MKALSRIAATVLLIGASCTSPAIVGVAVASPIPSSAAVPASLTLTHTTQGQDFWLAFEGNYDGASDLYLSVTSTDSTTGRVTAPGLDFTANFAVTAGEVTRVPLPLTVQNMTNDRVGAGGIHVTAVDPVTVSGLNTETFTSDGLLALPTETLGDHYIVQTYASYLTFGSQFEAVATADNTTVTITPSETVGAHPKGVPYPISLDAGQTYQLADAGVMSTDLTGTDVLADKPIAVLAGNRCASVPRDAVACNTLAEELLPTSAWGTSFITEPFATRKGDLFRVVAADAKTTVTVDGALLATLDAGEFTDTEIGHSAVISSDKPIQVMQYSQSHSVDDAVGDPFSLTVVPTSQFLTSYTVATPSAQTTPQITQNYLNIIAPSDQIAALSLDGSGLDTTAFSVIGTSGYSGAQVPVSVGAHRLDGPQGFGVAAYGYGKADGYGFPGGLGVTTTVSAATSAASAGSSASSDSAPTATPNETSAIGATSSSAGAVSSGSGSLFTPHPIVEASPTLPADTGTSVVAP